MSCSCLLPPCLPPPWLESSLSLDVEDSLLLRLSLLLLASSSLLLLDKTLPRL